MRQVIVAGNWKMNASKETVNTLIMGILSGMAEVDSTVIVCAPSPYMSQVEALITHSQLHLGAQDLNVNASGAFTGEVSADMIKDFGAQYVIVGHSERRSLYGETDEVVADKVQAALDNDLKPLFCIGETLEEREAGNMEAVVSRQIQAVIDRVGIGAFKDVIIAYEPVWAIGTGVTATPQQAQDAHAFIRSMLAQSDANIAQSTPILYGGSMNPGNAAELIGCEDIDGGLIGGASLKSEDFLQICKAG
ncbi:triose-phosphate isomerase [Candidatus Thioglobus sp.]|jgi:triosephosphate isomerase|uniref:triose-phosphate isomerase n=1 Tax=Candidatus Thioglobus sp. TaxID=2026721 RepID=UPI001DAA6EE0|nr:triose-phosphate isomerase [Candidatus Thioglobus sp.]MBT3276437.1 triose-phosphate isomerase [Candidatus Thioglobus sp.]MBT3446727.1 triose-phosphate isomerase [Candidatus Thioglobus sp.]MBT3744901.1 triose-phosphate isomerase [Candidatus Thioglobus sp.]MBT4001022.1 triose-phosphate isomerase [Candidatus Thioglobus sp.]MBT4181388.1 triose-phosphate isomerase [Candidatus Thioglobus sp.]